MHTPDRIANWPPAGPAQPVAPPPAHTCRVCVADGQTQFRTGLAVLLADLPGVVVVSQARNSTELFSEAIAHQPELLFIDLLLPGLVARPQLFALRRLLPRTRLVLLMADEDPQLVRCARELDVDAVLLRSAGRDQLEAMLGALRRGQRLPNLPQPAGREASPRLTQRERQILQQMARGLSNRGIAREAGLALPTVKFHVTHILSKLGAANRTTAVVSAMRLGLVQQVDEAQGPPALPAA